MKINVTNLTESTRIYFGIEFPPNETKDLLALGVTQVDLLKDEQLIVDWSKGLIQINDGLKDILSCNELIFLLKGNFGFLRTIDNKVAVKNLVRPLLTTGYSTSEGDDPSNPNAVGGGLELFVVHSIGDPAVITKDLEFNVEMNPSWIHRGHLFWNGAKGDYFSFRVYTKPCEFVAGTNTYFQTYENGLIIPAAQTGNINVTKFYPVKVTINVDTGKKDIGFWNFDYDSQTGQYSNPTPAPNLDGNYNIFYQELCLYNYLNNVRMVGRSNKEFGESDPIELPTNLKYRFIWTTYGPDHEWESAIILWMYRKRLL